MANFDFTKPIASELDIVEKRLFDNVKSELGLMNEASTHLIKAGGKRMRPAFALLAAKIFKEDLDDIISKIQISGQMSMSIDKNKDIILLQLEESSVLSEQISSSAQEVVLAAEEMSESTEEVSTIANKLSQMTTKMRQQVENFKTFD